MDVIIKLDLINECLNDIINQTSNKYNEEEIFHHYQNNIDYIESLYNSFDIDMIDPTSRTKLLNTSYQTIRFLVWIGYKLAQFNDYTIRIWKLFLATYKKYHKVLDIDITIEFVELLCIYCNDGLDSVVNMIQLNNINNNIDNNYDQLIKLINFFIIRLVLVLSSIDKDQISNVLLIKSLCVLFRNHSIIISISNKDQSNIQHSKSFEHIVKAIHTNITTNDDISIAIPSIDDIIISNHMNLNLIIECIQELIYTNNLQINPHKHHIIIGIINFIQTILKTSYLIKPITNTNITISNNISSNNIIESNTQSNILYQCTYIFLEAISLLSYIDILTPIEHSKEQQDEDDSICSFILDQIDIIANYIINNNMNDYELSNILVSNNNIITIYII